MNGSGVRQGSPTRSFHFFFDARPRRRRPLERFRSPRRSSHDVSPVAVAVAVAEVTDYSALPCHSLHTLMPLIIPKRQGERGRGKTIRFFAPLNPNGERRPERGQPWLASLAREKGGASTHKALVAPSHDDSDDAPKRLLRLPRNRAE